MAISHDEAERILATVFPPWIGDLGLHVVAIDDDRVRIMMPANDRIVRIGGIVSGQAAMAMADTAMVLASANALGGFNPVGTVGINCSFMRPIRNVGVVCETAVLRHGRTMMFCRATLIEVGQQAAAFEATGTYALPAASS